MTQEQSTDAKSTEGASSTPATSSDGDLVHTVDQGIPTIPVGGADTDPEAANKTGGDTAEPDAKATGGDGKDETGDKGGDLDDRFDKHPRFQQLNERVIKAEADSQSLRRELDEVKTRPPGGTVQEGELPYKDVSKMEDEDILEWQQSDPKGYHANQVAQAKFEMGQEVSQHLERGQYESKVEHTFEDFATKNPDFDPMWDRGELQAFMDRNPGHNAISAFMLLTEESRTQGKIDEAVKDSETKMQEGIKIRRESKVLGDGPSAAGATVDTIPQELQDTKKHGGLTKVLAARSAARMAKTRGG